MQAQNRIIDDLAKVLTGAAGAVSGAKDEVEGAIKGRLERLVAEMDFVPREEFDAMAEMARLAREQSTALETRVNKLEKTLAELSKK